MDESEHNKSFLSTKKLSRDNSVDSLESAFIDQDLKVREEAVIPPDSKKRKTPTKKKSSTDSQNLSVP